MKFKLACFIVVSCGILINLAACSNDEEDKFICKPGCVDESTIRKCEGNIPIDTFCKLGCSLEENRCYTEADTCRQQCLNANTLMTCDIGGNPVEQTCKAGCNEATNSCNPETAGCEQKCKNAGILITCDTNGNAVEKDCKAGCNEATSDCNPETVTCTPKCRNASTRITCDANGNAVEQNCKAGCNDATNDCNPETATCETKCRDANTLSLCNPDTGKATDTPCPKGCDSSTNACKIDIARCTVDVCKNSSTLLKCNTSTGIPDEQPCDYGCEVSKGKCRNLGDTCNPDEIAWCKDNDLIYCNTGNQLAKQTCSGDYICASVDDESKCYEKCTKEGDSSSVCGLSMQVQTVCTNTASGLLYTTPAGAVATPCDYGCQDNHVCADSSCDPTSFEEKCMGDHMLFCNEYEMPVNTDCSTVGKVCIYKTNKKTACALACNPDDGIKNKCYYNSDRDEYAYAEVKCTKGDTSYGFEIISSQICDHGCEDTSGCL